MIIRRYFHVDEIEDLALKLLRSYEREIGKPVSPPVDVDLIAECVCGLRIEWEFMPELLDEHPELIEVLSDEQKSKAIVLGGLKPRERLIVLNEKHVEAYTRLPGRERFTKAHEIAHWEMHIDKSVLDCPSLFEDADTDAVDTIICRAGDSSSLEWQANAFAAALLMPRLLFLEAAIPLNLIEWDAQYELAARFNVTISALTIRMKQLGLTFVDHRKKIHRSEAEAHGQQRIL